MAVSLIFGVFPFFACFSRLVSFSLLFFFFSLLMLFWYTFFLSHSWYKMCAEVYPLSTSALFPSTCIHFINGGEGVFLNRCRKNISTQRVRLSPFMPLCSLCRCGVGQSSIHIFRRSPSHFSRFPPLQRKSGKLFSSSR